MTIGVILMIDKINFNPNITQHNIKAKKNVPVTQPSFEGNCEMSSNVSNAYRAYGQAMVNKPIEQLSLDECVLQLQKQGKVEGKDYRLKDYENGNVALYLNNKDGQEAKRILFNDGKVDCWEDYKYSDGRLIKQIDHADGKIRSYQDFYYNNEIPQETFTQDKLTYTTTPEEYIEYLNKNNKNYKVTKDGEEDNNRSIYIDELDENDKIINSTWWYYGENKFNEKHQMLSRSEYDSNEAEVKRIELEQDRTGVCTYLEKYHRGKSILRSEVQQETFTKEHIDRKSVV